MAADSNEPYKGTSHNENFPQLDGYPSIYWNMLL